MRHESVQLLRFHRSHPDRATFALAEIDTHAGPGLVDAAYDELLQYGLVQRTGDVVHPQPGVVRPAFRITPKGARLSEVPTLLRFVTRPHMHCGECTVSAVLGLIQGYDFAHQELGKPLAGWAEVLNAVDAKLRGPAGGEPTETLATTLRRLAGGDEGRAVRLLAETIQAAVSDAG